MFRKGLIGMASVMLAMAGTAWAADDTTPPENPGNNNGDQVMPSGETPPPAENPVPAETPPPVRAPLMNGLDRIGVGPTMDHLGLNLYGYVEGGYLYDTTVPRNITPPKTFPGDLILFPGPYKSQAILDQVDLTFERAIDPTKGTFDAGFKISTIFGRDAFFTHSNGVLDQDNKAGGAGQELQLDIPEAYVDVAFPVADGLLIEGGKFSDLFGVEKIDPTKNLLYTHSYAFSFGMPFTQTGLLGKLYFTGGDTHPDDLTIVTAGVTRGWNQTLYDDNGVPDGVFGLYHRFEGGYDFTFNLNFGPEGVLPYGPADNSDYWALPELIADWHVTDQVTLTADAFLGTAQKLATWDGLAGYVTYVVSPRLSVNGRLEYYHDGHGLTTGVGGNNVDYGEITAGVGITPMPNDEFLQFLSLRPEIRYDWASAKVIDAGNASSQLTAAIDVLVKF